MVGAFGRPSAPRELCARSPRRRCARPQHSHHRLRTTLRYIQASNLAALTARPPAAPAARPRSTRSVRLCWQVAPGRSPWQSNDSGDRIVLSRVRYPSAFRLLARLRHCRGAHDVPRLRCVAQQPIAATRGVRHQRHESSAQRRAQLQHPRRLVGRMERRRKRLGHRLNRR